MHRRTNKQTDRPHRHLQWDMIRSFAILLVMLHHAVSLLNLDTPQQGLYYSLYRVLLTIDVPFFFMLTGTLILGKEPAPLGVFLRRRLKRLLLPFVFWGTLVYIVSAIIGKYPGIESLQSALCQYVPYMLTARVNVSHWFVYYMLGIYLLLPILQRALAEEASRSICRYLLVLWSVWMLSKNYTPDFALYHYFQSGGYHFLGYVILGHYLAHYCTDDKRNRRVGAMLFCCGVIVRVWAVEHHTDAMWMEVVEISGLFLWLKSLQVPVRMCSGVMTTARYSYAFYLMHLVPLAAWSAICLKARPLLTDYGLSMEIVATIYDFLPLLNALLIFLLCHLICRWMERIRWLPKVWIGW